MLVTVFLNTYVSKKHHILNLSTTNSAILVSTNYLSELYVDLETLNVADRFLKTYVSKKHRILKIFKKTYSVILVSTHYLSELYVVLETSKYKCCRPLSNIFCQHSYFSD